MRASVAERFDDHDRQAGGVTMRAVHVEQEATESRTDAAAEVEVSVVIPCLNEEEGIVPVVEQARAGLEAAGLTGEVIVVDNASEDRSAELARAAGATVVYEPRRGYGSAYLAGLAAARGDYIVMADADGTYDLSNIGALVEKLRDGAGMVLGSRFRGTIHPGAMPWPNRYIGNPILTGMLNVLFGAHVSDAHCGLRAVRREVVPQLELSATGMEFASEMVIKAGKRHVRIEEIPIDYHPRIGESKLSRVSDAWRHVRFMLVHSPTFLFLVPGGLTALGGLVGLCILAAMPQLNDNWTGVSVGCAILFILGAGIIELGLFSRTYAVIYLGEHDRFLEDGWRRWRLEHGLAMSALVFLAGVGITLGSFFDGVKDPRLGILGLALVAVGAQGAFASFFLSILGLSRHAILRRQGAGA
jgi:glycosyltransferase involved in cell wall biosynthesis